MSDIQKLQVAKHALNLMIAGVNVSRMKVGQIAKEVGAPTNRMNAKALLGWVSDKLMVVSVK